MPARVRPELTHFESPAEWRAWLEKNHDRATELTLVLLRNGSKKRGISYGEALDEALCFGWIDGVRRSIDDDFWCIRFTPRKPKSIWSAVNLKKMKALIASGRVAPAGLRTYESRDPSREKLYSFERPTAEFPPALEKRFRANKQAWAHFEAGPKGYAKTLRHWVTSAKKEETQLRRLEQLIDACARGVRLGDFVRERFG